MSNIGLKLPVLETHWKVVCSPFGSVAWWMRPRFRCLFGGGSRFSQRKQMFEYTSSKSDWPLYLSQPISKLHHLWLFLWCSKMNIIKYLRQRIKSLIDLFPCVELSIVISKSIIEPSIKIEKVIITENDFVGFVWDFGEFWSGSPPMNYVVILNR